MLLSISYCCPIAMSCRLLCDPMDCSTPGFPVLHCLPEFAQTHVRWVGDAIHTLLSLSNMHLSFPHVFSWPDSSFLFSAEYYFIVWMYLSSFIHSPTEGHLGYFWRTFWQLRITGKYDHPCASFCVDIGFQFIWVNIKGSNCWIIW